MVATANMNMVFKKRKAIILMSLASLIGTICYAADSTRVRLRKSIALVAIGGIENYFSINYEHIFATNRRLNWSYSVGLQPFAPSKKVSVPVSINAFTNGSRHHAEFDLTSTFYM